LEEKRTLLNLKLICPMRLIDQLVTEINGRNLLGEIKYICLNKSSKKQLFLDYEEEFKNEFDELGRQPNLFDVEEYFKMKIIVDDTITESEGYRLLTKAG